MSARKRTVSLSPDAQDDYDGILLYSLVHWGEERTQQYQAALDRALAELADYPEVGARRDELLPGYRARPVERHVIYYRIVADAVEVVRILHERMDAVKHLRS